MPEDRRARQRTGTGLGLLLALVLGAVLLTALPRGGERESGGCTPRGLGTVSADAGLTDEFARYGDDATRTDDWTGGDGTHSVRLPDGRVLWLFSDTYLGQVHRPPNPVGESYAWRDTAAPLVRNSAVVMDSKGRLESTLPAPLFPDPAPDQWRWPVAARVEPRSPGSPESVVRVLLWVRTAGQSPWIYGVPTATEVATLSLPDLRVESVVKVLDQSLVPDPSRRLLFGTTLVDKGGWTYVFGGDDGQAVSRPASSAYVARVPEGRLADPSAWRYWDGSGWGVKPRALRGAKVGSAFSVVQVQGTYVLFTMATGAAGLTTVTSYWSCSPTGPWHGPTKSFSPSLPRAGVAAYNPQAHPELDGDGRLVLSYDVNWLETTGASASINANVGLYRPRFVTVRLERA
ncbi:DUF4185 domain-containing protein [Streptomyces cylindrosporus]|uniref:DUF4185 domain-containing protein n=1 Tax=Streptomyces cylindrosporus TaxID=2927583 RepID=A0ABS9Y268_9ACTN|nr:DUF4185 domain-containing protein [Streptomyces cylindrosporus]MCI3271109.1 DUF4185 domain-containing protein [Streptomyces cylindrosporus]